MYERQSVLTDSEVRAHRAHGYETPRPDVQALVPTTAKRILELGCSNGALGAALKARNGAFVFGVELDPEYARQAEQRLDKVLIADVESFLCGDTPEEAPFDCLVAADVLEHLVDPWSALNRATDLLGSGASVVVSLPNVLFLRGLWRVIVGGRWPREDEGIFDRTHLRWFTMRDAIELPASVGLRVKLASPNYPGHGLRLTLTKLLGRAGLRRFLAVQWLVVAEKT
jgi:2-polyprenyl-3-methyl-5-hydroxy-6-metoxy-1,4-benzoquinol methylase